MILKNNIIIETPALTIPELSDDAKDRLDEVWRLSQDGMTPTQISKILNESNHTIPATFKHQQTPGVLFQRTNSIRSSILNYRKTIDDIVAWLRTYKTFRSDQ